MTTRPLGTWLLGTLPPRASRAPEEVFFAADFTRMLLQGTVSGWQDFVLRRDTLIRVVADRCRLPSEEAAMVVQAAEMPRFRGFVERREQDAFRWRFGDDGWQRLQATRPAELSLRDWPDRYGLSETLSLIDAMLEVGAAPLPDQPAGPAAADIRRVEAAAAEIGLPHAIVCALLSRHTARPAPIPVGERLRIGNSSAADLVLPDPQLPLVRAEIVAEGDQLLLQDLETGRPTLLNGAPISRAVLKHGDRVQIGGSTLTLDLPEKAPGPPGAARAPTLRPDHGWRLRPLCVQSLTRQIGEVSLLNDVSFTAFAGEVIAVIGPSGAGKTTLLHAISGIAPADSGSVTFDGQPLHHLLARDRSLIGVVPQDDLVHPDLTVAESFAYGARLRSPAGTPEQEIQASVERVLDELAIPHIRDSRIGDTLKRGISGGQRKRVNLGQELLTRSNRILFLDEPTSGLDPRAAADIVRLARQLADRGRIVFLVTHDLSSPVMAQVDHLLVLAPGGRTAFFGPPAEACRFFGVPSPDAIFRDFHQHAPDEWAARYRAAPACQAHVRAREALIARQIDPAAPPPPPPPPPGTLSHLRTLTARYARVRSRDRSGNLVLAAQPLVLAAVAAVVFPRPTASMLFMVSLSCLWFGMSGAVRELISDRAIWLRERRAGVSVPAYVGSKAIVLAASVTLQCLGLAGLVFAIHSLHTYDFSLAAFSAVSVLTGLAGLSLGLFISSLFSSSEGAVGTLPLLLIPQISFAALLVNLRNMTDTARWLSWLNPQRYAYDALLKTGQKIGEQPRYGGGWKEPVGMNGTLYDLGFKGSAEADMGVPLHMLAAVLAGFVVAFGVGTLIRVWRRS